MSLDYNLTKVRTDLPIDSEARKAWWAELDWDRFQSLVFNSMAIGINRITEDNYIDFYRRAVMLYNAKGWDTPYYNLQFVKEFIGMSTNVSPISDAAFKKVLLDALTATANKVIQSDTNQKED